MPQVTSSLKAPATLKLNNGFEFNALFTSKGLGQLDDAFLADLKSQDRQLFDQLAHYRHHDHIFDPKAHSVFLLALAPYIEDFLTDLFAIESAVADLKQATQDQDPVFQFKNHYVLRLAKRLAKKAPALPDFDVLNAWLLQQLDVTQAQDLELTVASYAQGLLDSTAKNESAIEKLTQWCVQALQSPEGRFVVRDWVSFKLPKKLHYDNLVTVEAVPEDAVGRLQGPPADFRQRDGFALTDRRMSERAALNEIDYCVYCHKNDGDFCSKGFPVKKNNPELGLKISPTGEQLTGCPLEEKISEMHVLKKEGLSIAALAMIMRDNPMCPATGHRICNDCMKGCIYQKQEPVNIPEVETRVLTDVLGLPWGVELYDLLTRWNPLRPDQFMMKPYNGAKVLVMGMGPAGFTMAHHLLMEGFAVVGCDGLKIEALDPELISQPIHDYATLEENLDNRVMSGFGGVAEYGITVRWDKNFLKLIYLMLMRRPYFQVFGEVRFGGTITVDEAWRLGFDHITLAVGAGLPKELHIPNSLAPGMRQANDFLMALQLTGAARESSLANLQVRLPAVVIGGGLTGVDTATEIQAYYIKQVEKTLFRYETLCQNASKEVVRATFNAEDLVVLDEFCVHGRLVREERKQATTDKREPDFIRLIRDWGGVTIVYRRSMQESPAYKRNHEELAKAFEEGIYYAEGLEPKIVELDASGNCQTLRCLSRFQDKEGHWSASDEELDLPARSIFVATGAKPNVAYAFEHAQDIERKKFEYPRYQEVEGELVAVDERGHIKMTEFGAFTSYENERRFVSFIGDTHPIFHGSVVKAVASAKRSYPRITKALAHKAKVGSEKEYSKFSSELRDLFNVILEKNERVGDGVVKLTLHAPQLARNFKPGQFYRLQNYERQGGPVAEGVACLGFKDKMDSDQLSFLLFDRGVSSKILMQASVGQPLAVMGPTGVRTLIPDQPESILIVGGRFAVAYLLSVAPAFKAAGHTLYFLAQFEGESFICEDQVKQFAQVADNLGALALAPSSIDQVHVIGYSDLLRKMQKARKAELAPFCKEAVTYKASVYGPMQCMLKGVCAQCLQWQVDPKTGKRTKAVYACSWQHQPLEMIDIDNLDERLAQNRMQERLTDLWYRANLSVG
ncbi:MAG: pyridine nucleotide-disulfide oxidoreductase [Coxiella sp. (in: Bacteria)]|nr:MAG: pyridine nucleotide-disulfide oxidoreductase [Coxiella sp. (in: g-proteobacteria)]